MTDFQKRPLKHIHVADDILRNNVRSIKACRILGNPLYHIEQVEFGDAGKEVREAASIEPIPESSLSYVKCKPIRETSPFCKRTS